MRQVWVHFLVMTLALTGCAVLRPAVRDPAPLAEAVVAPADLAAGQAAAALDLSSAAQRAAALAPAAAGGGRDLGLVVVALGNPVEQGFWLRSALIVTQGRGRVVTADGQSVAVDLLPGAGAALLSLAAFRALGLGLTDLPEVRVFLD